MMSREEDTGALFLHRPSADELLDGEAGFSDPAPDASSLTRTCEGSLESALRNRTTEEGSGSFVPNAEEAEKQGKSFAESHEAARHVEASEYGGQDVFDVDRKIDYADELATAGESDERWAPAAKAPLETIAGDPGAASRFSLRMREVVGDRVGDVLDAKDDLQESGEADEQLIGGIKNRVKSAGAIGRRAGRWAAEAAGGGSSVVADGTMGTAARAATKARYAAGWKIKAQGAVHAAKDAVIAVAKKAISLPTTAFAASAGKILLAAALLAALLFGGLGSCVACAALGGKAPTAMALTGNEATIARLLLDAGLSKTSTAAIVGNMRQESGCDPTARQSGGPGRGLLQWEEGGSRFEALCSLAAQEGKDWTDLETQIAFMFSEAPDTFDSYSPMYHEYPSGAVAGLGQYMSYEDWKAIEDLDWATEAWERVFTRGSQPEMDKRKEYAREIYAALSGGGSALTWALAVAADDSIGYSWGCARPDEYDCQGFVKAALRQSGEDVSWSYTGDMAQGLLIAGYAQHDYIESELQSGDILLYHFDGSDGTYEGHAAIWVGDGTIVEAINDFDGVAGDSGGMEIRVGPNWANGSWQYYFRKG